MLKTAFGNQEEGACGDKVGQKKNIILWFFLMHESLSTVIEAGIKHWETL